MAIHIIIDGYNLIRQSPELAGMDRQDLQLGRDALVDMLAAYKKLKPHKITVVFDGAAEPSLYGSRDRVKGIAIRYSQGGESADDVIRRMASREKAKALVVSSDREVMTAAESAGATALDSAAFEEKMAMARYLAIKGGEETVSLGMGADHPKKRAQPAASQAQAQARARVEKL
jgi:predicted RNA-binding protein with PIN domain